VLIDQGVDKAFVQRKGIFCGRWVDKTPDKAPDGSVLPDPDEAPSSHGRMMVRNIQSVAPRARIFDFPLVRMPPDPISRALSTSPVFLRKVEAAFWRLFADIAILRATGLPEWQAWVLVNAWAVVDSGSEGQNTERAVRYTDNLDHPLNRLIRMMVEATNVDMVFSASNCGDLCPDTRCGIADRGAGRSILGANGHPDVLTVGAVRTDGVLLGYSSVVPAAFARHAKRRDLSQLKPDLCAPSNFHEDDDAFGINTGTSTASGLAAGIVAVLRSCNKADQNTYPPKKIREILRKAVTPWDAATPPERGPKWDPGFGFGVINLERALARL